MPVIRLQSARPEIIVNEDGEEVEAYYFQELPPGAIKHCHYISGMIDAVPDSCADILVPHTDHLLIKFICAFLQEHQDDEEVADDWAKKKPRELTEWDKTNLEPIVGIPLVDLLKASSFLGCQLMLNAVATYVGSILVTKNEKEVQDYFGVYREFTKEEEEQVKAKYPQPFF